MQVFLFTHYNTAFRLRQNASSFLISVFENDIHNSIPWSFVFKLTRLCDKIDVEYVPFLQNIKAFLTAIKKSIVLTLRM